MSSKSFFVIFLILAAVAVFGLSVRSGKEPLRKENVQATTVLAAQTKLVGEVNIQVTPLSVIPGKDFIFELTMDTHLGDLGYDYTQIATLTDDGGNSLKPSRWVGGVGGHHVEGELIFPSLSDKSETLTLTLEGVDNKSEVFTWQL